MENMITVTVEDIVSPCRFCKGIVVITYLTKEGKINYPDSIFQKAICRDCGKNQVNDY